MAAVTGIHQTPRCHGRGPFLELYMSLIFQAFLMKFSGLKVEVHVVIVSKIHNPSLKIKLELEVNGSLPILQNRPRAATGRGLCLELYKSPIFQATLMKFSGLKVQGPSVNVLKIQNASLKFMLEL